MGARGRVAGAVWGAGRAAVWGADWGPVTAAPRVRGGGRREADQASAPGRLADRVVPVRDPRFYARGGPAGPRSRRRTAPPPAARRPTRSGRRARSAPTGR